MMKRINLKKIVFLSLFFALLSCEPDEPVVDPSEAGSMTCTLNGAPWAAISFNNTLLRITDEPTTGKRLDLRGKGMGIQLILTCGITSSSTGTTIPIQTYTTGSSNEALVTIMEGFSILAMATGVEGDPATIHLTEIDGVSKTCSGTFSFKARDISTNEITHEALSGVFTDLVYVIM